jgi:hypothetical protein
MKRLLVTGLVLTVASASFAAQQDLKLDLRAHSAKATSGNLSPVALVKTASNSTQEDANLSAEGPRYTVRSNNQITTHQVAISAEHEEYMDLKSRGEVIPEDLHEAIFGARNDSSIRTGGDGADDATVIDYVAGGEYTDTGNTTANSDAILAGDVVAPNDCSTSFYAGSSFGGPDTWYTFTLPEDASVAASTCNDASYDTCLGIFDESMTLVAVNDDGAGCDSYSSLLPACNLSAGTYYLVVDSWGVDSGDYGLTVNFQEAIGPCEDYDCTGLDDEGEGWTMDDTVNGGCNSEPPVWMPLDTPGELCGSFYTYNNGETDSRDTDWYEVLLFGDSYLTVEAFSCATTAYSVALYNGTCDAPVQIAWHDGDAFGEVGFTSDCLPAGTYWVIVLPNVFTGMDDEVAYHLAVDAQLCEVIECEDYDCTGLDDEGEGYSMVDNFNGGCNSDPAVFSDLDAPGEICGTFYTYNDGSGDSRDTDWYEFTTLEDSFINVLAHSCMDGNYAVALADGECPNPNIIEFIFPEDGTDDIDFTSTCLPAGTYMAIVLPSVFVGYAEEVNYHLEIALEACEEEVPCEDAVFMECESTMNASSVMSAGNVWEEYCNGGEDGPEVVFEIEHPGGFLTIEISSETTNDLDLVLLGSCDPLDCLAMPWEIGSNETISDEYDAGTYYAVVDCYAWDMADYTFEISVSCGVDPCEGHIPITCDGTAEAEPNEGWNADPPNSSYNDISCDEVICGTTWAADGSRDLDWYLLEHEGGDIEVVLEVDEFNGVLFLTEFDSDGAQLSSENSNGWCEGEVMYVSSLDAGSYFIVVTHNEFEGVPDDQNYSVTVTCMGDPCADHTPITCDGVAEVEPNEGWNADPPNSSYNDINMDETLCGTTWAADGSRDLDWYRFETTGDPMNIQVVAEMDEVDGLIFLADFDDSGNIITAVDAVPACTTETLVYECLQAGEYYIIFAPNDFYGWPDDVNYSLTMTSSVCTPPEPCDDIYVVDTPLNGSYIMSRPAPIANHHDAGNGCTTAGSSAGYDELHELILVQTEILDIIHNGDDNDSDEAIMVLTDCNFTESCVAFVDNNGGDNGPEEITGLELDAGTYYIVADYWGSAETFPYTLEVVATALDPTVTPEKFELNNNYPNPFNPVTTISWTQPNTAPAKISIYNIMGELVESHNAIRGAGTQTFVWDASSLSSGVYMYTVETLGQTKTSKAILLK